MSCEEGENRCVLEEIGGWKVSFERIFTFIDERTSGFNMSKLLILAALKKITNVR